MPDKKQTFEFTRRVPVMPTTVAFSNDVSIVIHGCELLCSTSADPGRGTVHHYMNMMMRLKRLA